MATVTKITQARPTFRFTRINLSDADKATLATWAMNEQELIDSIESMLSSGYKLTVTHDPDQRIYVVSQIGNDPNRPDCNLCATSRHKTMSGALTTMIYKWTILLSGGPLPLPNERPSATDIWD